jgi:NADPH:quinone reductase-like Zn-dependent oxidoreductase/acyl carrier protein
MRRTKWAELLPAHNYTVSTIIADALDINADEFTHSLIIAQANPAAVFSTTEPAKVFTPVVIQPASLVELLKSAQENVTAHEDAATASPFWVVTKGAQPIPDANGVPRVARPEAAEAIGFTRVLSSEYPKHDIRILDFSADATDDQVTQWVNKLASLVAANSLPDRELSIRDDKVWVSRLVPINTNATAVVASQQKSKKVHFKLDIATKGQLQTLFYTELPERPLASQDVVVDVYASAMNFKDLMIALGMINVPLKNGTSSVNLGLEFSGVVAAVGSNVTNFKVGDEVFGVGNHCFATRVYTTTDFVVKKPAHLTHIEAASIPICFATSYAALIAKARISKGETALIHAGAGGIGQTSIQLCKHFGADVITTVSSEEKRQFLQTKYGVTKFSDSRDNAAWGRDVQTLTNGKGVDVVVNSLKGKAIEIGMDSLSLGGRFVEIGKVDILNNSKLGMGVFLRDTSLHSVQLDIVMDEYPQLMRRYLGEIASLAEQKAIQPIVDKVFPAKDIEGAFRFIMSGKHKGKIIVDYSADQLPAMETVKCFVFNPDTLYVISGGLGALGWESWKWMVGEGARRFLLLSRSGKVTAPQQADIDAFAAQGVSILVAKCDVANREEVFAAYKSAEAKGLLNATTGKVGILHMAMVLRDAGVKNMTEQHLNEAVACKVDGARNLVEYFGGEAASRIEFLSLFSSISSAFGNPDQSNYAAGNSYLDAYAIYLKYEKGVAASVINLAAVEDIGVLAEDFKLRQMSKLRGLHGGLTSVGVLEQLRTMITNPTHVQWIHGNFDFRSLGDTFPLLKSKADHLVDYRMKLGAADAGAGGNVASIESVTLIVARLFSVDPKTIDPSAPLTGLGLDSLMAVELASTLKKSFGIQTTQMELLGGMSIEKIVSKAQQ